MSLWDEVGRIYARPGVEALCLELQDDHGQCVSFLLWAGWAARAGRFPDPAELEAAVGLARAVEISLLRPVRGARRGLKREGPETAYAVALAAELDAERRLLEALEQAAPPEVAMQGGARLDVARGLAMAAAAWGGEPPTALIAALAAAFSPG